MLAHAIAPAPTRNPAPNRATGPEPDEAAATLLRAVARGETVAAQTTCILQAANGLPQTGVVSAAELSVALHVAGGAVSLEEAGVVVGKLRERQQAPWPTVPVSEVGLRVAVAQRALGVTGDLPGRQGPRTAEAVSDAQRRLGLAPTGRLDAPTWEALAGELEGDLRELDVAGRDLLARLLGRCGAVCVPTLEGLLAGLDRLQRGVGLPRQPHVDAAAWRLLLADDPDPIGAAVTAAVAPMSREGARAAVDLAVASLDAVTAAIVGPVLRQAADAVGAHADAEGHPYGGGYWSPEIEDAHGVAPWSTLALGSWFRTSTGLADLELQLFGRRLGTPAQLLDWARRRAVLVPGDVTATTGDVALCGPRGEAPTHAAIVVADLGRRLHTLEADVHGRVVERVRHRREVSHLVRWSRWVVA